MAHPTITAARASKVGLAGVLAALRLPSTGALAFATPATQILYRCPGPGVTEVRPRAVIVGALDYERMFGDETTDNGDGTSKVHVGTADGGLRILLSCEDPIAGGGGSETDADEIAAALEQAFHKGAAGELIAPVPDAPLHGVAATVAAYHNALFVYVFQGVDDPPLELVERGIAEVVVRIGVVGPVYRQVVTPATDPALTVAAGGGAVETVIVNRIY